MPATSTAAKRAKNLQLQVMPTAGERSPDGTFLELVRDSVGSSPQLLRYQAGQSIIAPEQELEGRRYAACENAAKIRHLVSKLAPYETSRKLFDRVHAFI